MQTTQLPDSRFNIGDTVWYISGGKAAEGLICGKVLCRQIGTKEPEWRYRCDEGFSSSPVLPLREKEMFASKEELIASL